ncbi:MAG: hypothetical protein V1889_01835 [archaeon]
MKSWLVVLMLVLIMCEFVVGGVYSEVETSFVISPSEEVSLGFWGMYGDFLVAGLIVLVVVVIYLNAGKKVKRKRRK